LEHSTKNDTKLNTKVEILKKSPYFYYLNNDQLKQIASIASFRYFNRNDFLFHEGDPANFLFVVCSGKVKQFKMSLTGKGFTTAIMSSGDPLNAVAMFGASAYFVSAQAMSETTVLSIAKEEFLSFVNKYPVVAIRYISILGRVLNSAYERLTDLAGETAGQRVFNVLYMLHFKFGDKIPITREEIAEMAGTTTETTIRVLSKLKSLEIIDSRRGQIVMLNKNKFRDISRSSYLIFSEDL
jgi:CRP-like cAMP-binding protein